MNLINFTLFKWVMGYNVFAPQVSTDSFTTEFTTNEFT